MNQQKLDNTEVYQRFTNLSNRDLSYKDLRGYDLTGANLVGAKLIEVNLSGAILKLADLSNADLSLADLTNADLEGANLKGANLSGANLKGAKIRETNFEDANLTVVETDWHWWDGIGLFMVPLVVLLLLLIGAAWGGYTAGYHESPRKQCVQADIGSTDPQPSLRKNKSQSNVLEKHRYFLRREGLKTQSREV